MSDWNRFTSALRSKGKTFEAIKNASDRRSVITAFGFSNPLEVACIETEWAARAGEGMSTGQKGKQQSTLTAASPSSGAGGRKATEAKQAAYQQLSHDPSALCRAPEEIQDYTLANEVLDATLGITGAYFQLTEDAQCLTTDAVPPTARGALTPICRIVESLVFLNRAREIEFSGASLVSMAMGEALSDIVRAYFAQIKELRLSTQQQRLPLVRVLSNVNRLGYPILRLSKLLEDIQINGVFPSGSKLIHSLHAQHTRSAGNCDDEELIGLVLRRAAEPYLKMLVRWIDEGVLNDPYNEFFVEQNHDYEDPEINAKLRWDRRFCLRKNEVPGFLQRERLAGIALLAGKLRNLLHECGEDDSAPPTVSDLHWGDTEELQRVITRAHEATSRAVIHLLLSKYDLVGHMKCLHHYFLLGQGDWLIDFLDTAEELLEKSPGQIKAHSIKVLLQSAIMKNLGLAQTTTAMMGRTNSDGSAVASAFPTSAAGSASRHATRVGCSFSDSSLLDSVDFSLGGGGGTGREGRSTVLPPTRQSTVKIDSQRCIELLQLDYEVDWPASLVIQPLFLNQLNFFFRLLLWCRRCERAIATHWFSHDAGMAAQYQLRQQMLQFLRQFQFYSAYYVVEPLFEKMLSTVTQAGVVADLDRAVNEFWEDARRGMILSDRHRFHSLAQTIDTIQKYSVLPLQRQLSSRDLERIVHAKHTEFLRNLAQLANPQGHDYPLVVPLLSLLDFNRFYQRKNIYHVVLSAAAEAELSPEADETEEE